MTHYFIKITVLISYLISCNNAFAGEIFGANVSGKAPKNLTYLIKNFSDIKGDVTTEGEVTKVCKKSGCWMALTDGNTSLRVTFKDYDFFVPQNILGKKVKVEGKVYKRVTSVKDQRHYLRDEGASQKDAEKITKAKTEYSFVASGVQVL